MSKSILAQRISSLISSYRFHGTFRSDDVENLKVVADDTKSTKSAGDSTTIDHAAKILESGETLSEAQEQYLLAALLNINDQEKKVSIFGPTVIGVIGILVSIVIAIIQLYSEEPGKTKQGDKGHLVNHSTEQAAPESGTEEMDFSNANKVSDDADGITPEVTGKKSSELQMLILAVQLIVVFTFFVYSEGRYRTVRRFQNATIERRIVEQFAFYSRWIWASWVALYVALLLEEYITIPAIDSWLLIFAEVFNNWTSASFLITFAVLDQPSIELSRGDNRNKPFVQARRIAIALAIVCSGVFALGEIISVAAPSLRFATQLPTALFAGVAMAYFVGRIDSKFFNIPRLKIGFLYAYAVIQVTWPAIQNHTNVVPEIIKSAIFLFSLFGKFVLWRILESFFDFDATLLRKYITWAAEHVRKLDNERRAWQAGSLK